MSARPRCFVVCSSFRYGSDCDTDRGKWRREIELISEYASVIPTTLIPKLLGLPIGDSSKFRAFIHSLAVHMLDLSTRGYGTSHLLVFQQLNVEISLMPTVSDFANHLQNGTGGRPQRGCVSDLAQDARVDCSCESDSRAFLRTRSR